MNKRGVPYPEVRKHVRSFDLFLFRGKDFVSDTISSVERRKTGFGDFTHVGICLLGEDFPPDSALYKQDTVYIFESTMSEGVPDIVDGESHLGVQLRDMDAVVKAYDASPKTHIAWAPLLPTCRPRVCELSFLTQSVCDRYGGTFYNASIVNLLGAAVPVVRFLRDRPRCCAPGWACYASTCCCCFSTSANDRPDRWLFCSELAANIYRDIGSLPARINPKNVLPVDFVPLSKDSSKTHDADGDVPVITGEPVYFYWPKF